MKISNAQTFWVVTKPTKVSTLQDILFECDIPGLALQFKGGLDPENIHAVYTKKGEAETAATCLLSKGE